MVLSRGPYPGSNIQKSLRKASSWVGSGARAEWGSDMSVGESEFFLFVVVFVFFVFCEVFLCVLHPRIGAVIGLVSERGCLLVCWGPCMGESPEVLAEGGSTEEAVLAATLSDLEWD